MSYKKLEIWQLACELSVDIHRMTLRDLPKFEMYEEGAQIRRAVKSVRSNIVEGYGRRRYKQDYLRFLTYAHSSCDETLDHLETLFQTESLTDEAKYDNLHARVEHLGRKLNRFISSVETKHQSVRESKVEYETGTV